MKKIIYIIIGLMSVTLTKLKAQQVIASPEKIWTVPAIYTMDETVTWYFDMASSVQVSDGEALYMWIWAPKNPTNTPIPLTYNGNRVWSITLKPTEFFGMTVEQLFDNKENFFFLIRDLNATKLTGTLSLPKADDVKEFIKGGKVMDYAPTNFQLNGSLTILFNSNLVPGFNPVNATIHLHSGLNDWTDQVQFQAWLPDVRQKTAFRHLGNGIYKKDLVPKTYFNVDADYDLQNMTFVIAKYNGNDANPDWAGASQDFKIIAPGVPIPPAPKFSLFPLKISINDILVITRDNNTRGQRLSYTLKGGNKTLTGNLEGTMARQRAIINVLKEFKGMDISQLHLSVKDQNASVIFDGDVPLIKVDKAIK